MNYETDYWNIPDNRFPENYYEDYGQFQNQSLDFNTVDPHGTFLQPSNISKLPPASFQDSSFEDEPPLLEELEIYPDRIIQKMLAVLNPFRGHGLTDDADYLNKDPDLAGPVFFYLVLAICLLLSGNKAHFGYIYGISVFSCVIMYSLLTLMTSNKVFNLTTVASVLGYSLIPIVALSLCGIFLSLKGIAGGVLALLAVLWSSISASRLFVAISGDKQQQPLIAYPCALVSAIYVLLVIF